MVVRGQTPKVCGYHWKKIDGGFCRHALANRLRKLPGEATQPAESAVNFFCGNNSPRLRHWWVVAEITNPLTESRNEAERPA
jgi:hypothetical protein